MFTFKDISAKPSGNSDLKAPMIELRDFNSLSKEVINSIRTARASSAAESAVINEHEDSTRTARKVSMVAHTEIDKTQGQIKGIRADQQRFFSARR